MSVPRPADDTEELAEVRAAVAAVCTAFDDEYWSACDAEHRFPWEFYGEMAAGGWIGIAIPERYGGGGAASVTPPRCWRRSRRPAPA